MKESAMAIQLDHDDPWASCGYGQASIEPVQWPAVLTIGLQYAFSDTDFVFGGVELITRAIVSTARLLAVAREAAVPIFHTIAAWRGENDVGLWMITLPSCAEITPDSRWAQVDAHLWADRDTLPPKKWLSFFHGAPLRSLDDRAPV